jgi:hypothetical protein
MVDLDKLKQSQSALKGGKEKVAKVKLTKEQQLYVKQLVSLENRIAVCREYIGLWMDFFRFFAEDITQREIKAEEEKAFFYSMTQLARKHFLFVELMGDAFERGGDIMNILCVAISLANVQAIAENTRSKLELDWHTLYLDMNKTLGRLIRMLPGNLTLSQALAEMDKIAPINGKGATPAPAKKEGGKLGGFFRRKK